MEKLGHPLVEPRLSSGRVRLRGQPRVERLRPLQGAELERAIGRAREGREGAVRGADLGRLFDTALGLRLRRLGHEIEEISRERERFAEAALAEPGQLAEALEEGPRDDPLEAIRAWSLGEHLRSGRPGRLTGLIASKVEGWVAGRIDPDWVPAVSRALRRAARTPSGPGEAMELVLARALAAGLARAARPAGSLRVLLELRELPVPQPGRREARALYRELQASPLYDVGLAWLCQEVWKGASRVLAEAAAERYALERSAGWERRLASERISLVETDDRLPRLADRELIVEALAGSVLQALVLGDASPGLLERRLGFELADRLRRRSREQKARRQAPVRSASA